jgi:predicted CXXCH cytochrome family protein
MRHQHLTQLIGTLVVATALVGFPTVAFAGIAGSAHDLSTELTTPNAETCIVCHTPHNAKDPLVAAPLWNHEVSATASYTIYDSDTLDATVGQPSGASKLCLSCHDGTVAIDNYGGVTTGTQTLATLGMTAVDFGTDLSNDHPISFTYDDALAGTDGGLETPSDTVSGIAGGGFIAGDMLFGATNDQLECASCHDVHDALSLTNLLLIPNTNSDLCLTCHIK